MTDYLDEIQARADAATDGPWEHVGSYGRIVSGPVQVCRAYGDDGKATPDAPFIAHARTDIPRLVAALRAVEALVAPYRSRADGWSPEAALARAVDTAIRDALDPT